MNDWRPTIIAPGTAIVSIIAIVTAMQFQFAGLRAEMRAEYATIRDQLNSVDRRTARIERRLFGIEVAPDPRAAE